MQGPHALKLRFEYGRTSRAGFVELAPGCKMVNLPTVVSQEFYDALAKLPSVARVEWKESKTSQDNVGNHYMQRNVMVYVPGFAARPSSSSSRGASTRKKWRVALSPSRRASESPHRGLEVDAWRILMHVVRGKELLPEHAREYCSRALKGWAPSRSRPSRTTLRGARLRRAGAQVRSRFLQLSRCQTIRMRVYDELPSPC